MGDITNKFASTFRDYETAGVPGSGPHEPVKADIRQAGVSIDSAVAQLAAAFVADAATVIYAARSSLYANLAPSDRAIGLVYNDGANNGLYIKNGATGTGSWNATGLMLTGAKGDAGKSFYETALTTGYVPAGTSEADFVNAVALAVSAASAANLAPITTDLALGATSKLATIAADLQGSNKIGAVAGAIDKINLLGTTSVIASMTALSAPAVLANMAALSPAQVIANMATLAPRAADMATLAPKAADIATVAANAPAVSTVATDLNLGASSLIRQAPQAASRANNSVPFATWTALAAATGMAAGDRATVRRDDTGTHTDPVAGGTVSNTGQYTYSASPAGWQRVATLDSQIAETQAGIATAAGTAFGAAAAVVPALQKVAEQAAPPAIRLYSYGKTNATGAAAGTNLSAFYFTDATRIAGADGWLKPIAIYFNTAVAGRTVTVQAGRAGLVAVTLGTFPVTSTGYNTVPLGIADAYRVQAGDVILVTCSHTGSDGIGYDVVTGGLTTIRPSNNSTTPRAIGASYTDNTTSATNIVPRVAWNIVPLPLFVTTSSIDVANGVPSLDMMARLKSSQMPAWVSDGQPRTSANTVVTERRRTLLSRVREVRRDTAPGFLQQLSFYADANGDGGTYSNLSATQSFIQASWVTTDAQPGIPVVSTLQRLMLPPNLTVGGATAEFPAGGGKIQAVLHRPRQSLIGLASGAAYADDWVADLFEYIVPAGTNPSDLFLRFSLPKQLAQPGDLIFLRGVNIGMALATSDSAYNNDRYIRITSVTDTSMAALREPFTGTVASGTRIPMRVQYAPGPVVSEGDGPGALMALDENANIPKHKARAIELPWVGKTIVICGTSQLIRSSTAGSVASDGYLYGGYGFQILDALQGNGINQALGSSSIAFRTNPVTGAPQLSLSATVAELNAYSPGNGGNSYETKLIAPNPDLVFLGHGFNDTPYPLGTIDSMDKTTFTGAMNFVINAALQNNKKCEFKLFTPEHLFDASGNIMPERVAIRNRIFEIGAKWSMQVIDVTQLAGINAATFNDAVESDKVHIKQWVYDRLFRNIMPLVVI